MNHMLVVWYLYCMSSYMVLVSLKHMNSFHGDLIKRMLYIKGGVGKRKILDFFRKGSDPPPQLKAFSRLFTYLLFGIESYTYETYFTLGPN